MHRNCFRLLALLLLATGTLQQLLSWPGTPEIEESHLVTLLATGSAFSGIALGWLIYLGYLVKPQTLAAAFRMVYVLFVNKWYVDEIYGAVFIRPTKQLSQALAWFDDHVIDRVGVDGAGWVAERLTVMQSWLDDRVVDQGVDGTGWVLMTVGGWARRLQTGFVQNYLLMIALGFVALIFWQIF